MIIVKFWLPVRAGVLLSVTVTVIGKEPLAVGVPLMMPEFVENVMPAGSEPLVIAHV